MYPYIKSIILFKGDVFRERCNFQPPLLGIDIDMKRELNARDSAQVTSLARNDEHEAYTVLIGSLNDKIL